MSEQEIKNLRLEMSELTKSVNDFMIMTEKNNKEAMEIARACFYGIYCFE